MTTPTVHAYGLQSLIEDRGRIGLRSAGVGVSGAADRAAFALANRMVGNNRTVAAVGCLLGGLSVSADATVAVAVTGADAPVTIDGTPAADASTIWLRLGQRLTLGRPTRGLRSYLAVRGGIALTRFSARAAQTPSGLGPPPS